MLENEAFSLTRAQRGDPEAFSKLVDTYQKPVFNLCYRMLGNPGDAEDAAQETFLRAYKAIKRYNPKKPFATWLLSIAAHYCIDQLRKRRMTLVAIDEMPYKTLADDSPGPEREVSQLEERARVQQLLHVLSPVDRAAVVMYYWQDYSYDEIADVLSLTLSAVKSRLHRARRSMAKAWPEVGSRSYVMERNAHGEQSPAY